MSVDIGETRAVVQAFAQEKGLTFPILLDETGAVADLYGVQSVPSSVLIDREGIVRAARRGAIGEQEKVAIGLWVETAP